MREKLTLEERIARAARSQASSPEAAAGLVRRLAQLHTVHIFHGNADLNLMYALIGPYIEQIDDDLLHYSGFCRSFQLAIFQGSSQAEADAPFRPALGTRASNAIVLLGLMLLDHAKGRGRDKEVHRCTRMTLGQYLDALETLAFSGDEAPGPEFQNWRELFLSFHDPSAPLADVLADLLRQYIHGWKMFDCLDHVLRRMEGRSGSLEEETADLDLDCSRDVPDPAGEGISARDVRDQIFLPDRDFSLASLRAMAGEAPTPELRVLLERFISEQWLSAAALEVNEAVSNLFMLWVGPYLWME